jgi:hypothetical protein
MKISVVESRRRPASRFLPLIPIATAGAVVAVLHVGLSVTIVVMAATAAPVLLFLGLSPRIDARLNRRRVLGKGLLLSCPATLDRVAGRVDFDQSRLVWRSKRKGERGREVSIPWGDIEELRLRSLGGLPSGCEATLVLSDGSNRRLAITSNCRAIERAAGRAGG